MASPGFYFTPLADVGAISGIRDTLATSPLTTVFIHDQSSRQNHVRPSRQIPAPSASPPSRSAVDQTHRGQGHQPSQAGLVPRGGSRGKPYGRVVQTSSDSEGVRLSKPSFWRAVVSPPSELSKRQQPPAPAKSREKTCHGLSKDEADVIWQLPRVQRPRGVLILRAAKNPDFVVVPQQHACASCTEDEWPCVIMCFSGAGDGAAPQPAEPEEAKTTIESESEAGEGEGEGEDEIDEFDVEESTVPLGRRKHTGLRCRSCQTSSCSFSQLFISSRWKAQTREGRRRHRRVQLDLYLKDVGAVVGGTPAAVASALEQLMKKAANSQEGNPATRKGETGRDSVNLPQRPVFGAAPAERSKKVELHVPRGWTEVRHDGKTMYVVNPAIAQLGEWAVSSPVEEMLSPYDAGRMPFLRVVQKLGPIAVSQLAALAGSVDLPYGGKSLVLPYGMFEPRIACWSCQEDNIQCLLFDIPLPNGSPNGSATGEHPKPLVQLPSCLSCRLNNRRCCYEVDAKFVSLAACVYLSHSQRPTTPPNHPLSDVVCTPLTR